MSNESLADLLKRVEKMHQHIMDQEGGRLVPWLASVGILLNDVKAALRAMEWVSIREHGNPDTTKKYWVAYDDTDEGGDWFMCSLIYEFGLGWLGKTPNYYCDCLPPPPGGQGI